MRVLLAGATGETGISLLRTLTSAGHQVRVLVRASSLVKLAGIGVPHETHVGDVTDPPSLAGACAGIDVVISTITRTQLDQTHAQVDFAGNLALLREAERAGAARFIYVSSLGAGSDPRIPNLREKGRFEAELRASRLGWLILRPSALFQDMDRILEQSRGGSVTLFGNGRQRVTPLAEEDLAEFMTGHLAGPSALVEIGGPETLTLRQVAELCLAVRGKSPKVRLLPAGLFAGIVAVVRVVAPTHWPVMRFVQYVFTHDNAADEIGQRRLRDHFDQVLAGGAAHGTRTSMYRP